VVKYIKLGIVQKELFVEERKRNELETKLKKMFDDLNQSETKRKQPAIQSGTGNVIRRRKDQEEKRFSI
jgi:hypothetical protein